VARYRIQKTLGCYVKNGEKGIMLLAPVFRRRTEENKEADIHSQGEIFAVSRESLIWY